MSAFSHNNNTVMAQVIYNTLYMTVQFHVIGIRLSPTEHYMSRPQATTKNRQMASDILSLCDATLNLMHH